MTVFISWSGPLSKEVAELLNSWLPDVIQGVKTWLSSEDIEKGSIWSGEINEALATTVGVLCVTQANKSAPWLLFEAGGLSKGLTKARVCPLLIDLQPQDLQPPLSLFNLTLPERDDIWKLVRTINSADKKAALDQARLKKSFDNWWPEFEKGLKQIREKYKSLIKPPERSERELIVEVLDIVRALQRHAEDEEFRQSLSVPLTSPTAAMPPFEWVNAPVPKLSVEQVDEILEHLNASRKAEQTLAKSVDPKQKK